MRWFILLAALGAATGLAAGLAGAADTSTSAAPSAASILATLFDDPVIAKGKGIEIKRSQLDDAFTAFRANQAMRGQTVPEQLRAFREAQLLDRLILNKVLNARATDADKTRGKELTDKLMADTRKEFSSEETFVRRIKALGLTLEQFTQRVQEQALADAVLDREVKSKIVISDNQVGDFYTNGTDVLVQVMEEAVQKMANDPNTTLSRLTEAQKKIEDVRKANLARLEQPERVRVQHIFMVTRERQTDGELPDEARRAKRAKMDQLLKRARDGEDFTALVLENSEDQNVKQTKGEYTFSRQDPFVPEFKAAAFSMQTNQISDVVVTPFGYHIIKLLEKIPPRKVEFEKAAPDLKEFLTQQEIQRQLPVYFDAIKKEVAIEILDPKYKIDLPKDVEPPKTTS